MNRSLIRQAAWLAPVILLLGVLGLWRTVAAQNAPASGAGKPPFANAIDQRDEMIRELRDIRALMKEQNALLEKLVEHAEGKAKPKR